MLRQGRIRILVATDVAARGLDIPNLALVINFDLPRTLDEYIHRIGRTGRAGGKGVALSFASKRDRFISREVEKFAGLPSTFVEKKFGNGPRGNKKPFRKFGGGGGKPYGSGKPYGGGGKPFQKNFRSKGTVSNRAD
jgi:superfamily II DNA/RNA helicase